MKIDAEKLKIFLEKISLKQTIPTALLNFSKEGIKANLHVANIAMTTSLLKKEAFTEYEALGEIGIRNIATLIEMLRRYKNKQIQISMENNKLKMVSENGSAFYVLCNKEYVDNHLEKSPNFEKLDGGVNIDVAKFESIKDASNILNVKEIFLVIKDKKMTLYTENESGDKITEELDIDYKDCSSKYGEYLHKVIEVSDGVVNIALANDYPIRVKEKKEHYQIQYTVAPLVKNED